MSASRPGVPSAREDAGLRRLDHVAVAVHATDRALEYFCGTLGLEVAHVDELQEPPVTLTYLDAGNILIQLVSPRGPCEIARWLDTHGEGLHHICFAADDVSRTVERLSDDGVQPQLGSGRGRVASFVHNGSPFGVLIECTEFRSSDGPARGARPEPG